MHDRFIYVPQKACNFFACEVLPEKILFDMDITKDVLHAEV